MNERNKMEYVDPISLKRKCKERKAGGEIRLEHIK